MGKREIGKTGKQKNGNWAELMSSLCISRHGQMGKRANGKTRKPGNVENGKMGSGEMVKREKGRREDGKTEKQENGNTTNKQN